MMMVRMMIEVVEDAEGNGKGMKLDKDGKGYWEYEM